MASVPTYQYVDAPPGETQGFPENLAAHPYMGSGVRHGGTIYRDCLIIGTWPGIDNWIDYDGPSALGLNIFGAEFETIDGFACYHNVFHRNSRVDIRFGPWSPAWFRAGEPGWVGSAVLNALRFANNVFSKSGAPEGDYPSIQVHGRFTGTLAAGPISVDNNWSADEVEFDGNVWSRSAGLDVLIKVYTPGAPSTPQPNYTHHTLATAKTAHPTVFLASNDVGSVTFVDPLDLLYEEVLANRGDFSTTAHLEAFFRDYQVAFDSPKGRNAAAPIAKVTQDDTSVTTVQVTHGWSFYSGWGWTAGEVGDSVLIGGNGAVTVTGRTATTITVSAPVTVSVDDEIWFETTGANPDVGASLARAASEWVLIDTIAAAESYTDFSVDNDSTYQYYVTALNASFESLQSNTTEEQTPVDAPPPDPPTNVVGIAGDDLVTVQWQHSPSAGVTTYEPWRRTRLNGTYGAWSQQDLISATLTEWVDNVVDNDTTYQYRLIANAGAVESAPSNDTGDVTPTVPPPPQPPDAPVVVTLVASLNPTQVEVNYDGSTSFGVLGHKIYRRRKLNGSYTAWTFIWDVPLPLTIFKDGPTLGLLEGATYQYYVTAYDDELESGPSNNLGDVTVPTPPSPPPSTNNCRRSAMMLLTQQILPYPDGGGVDASNRAHVAGLYACQTYAGPPPPPPTGDITCAAGGASAEISCTSGSASENIASSTGDDSSEIGDCS
jgi:fibronectin type 3 domain-containing protein